MVVIPYADNDENLIVSRMYSSYIDGVPAATTTFQWTFGPKGGGTTPPQTGTAQLFSFVAPNPGTYQLDCVVTTTSPTSSPPTTPTTTTLTMIFAASSISALTPIIPAIVFLVVTTVVAVGVVGVASALSANSRNALLYRSRL